MNQTLVHSRDESGRLIRAGLNELLNSLLSEPPGAMMTGELQNLLHELQAHQIELENHNRELRESQQQLAESRDRYASLYDFAPVGCLTLDAKGTILDINLRGGAMLGRERAQLVGMPLVPLLAPGESHLLFEHLEQVFSTEARIVHELTLREGDLVSTVVRMESIALTRGEGEARLCQSVIIDITEQRQAQLALRQEHDRAQCYLDTVEAIMVALDRDGNIRLINRKGCELLGYKETELLGKNWFTTCLPATKESDATMALFGEVMAGNLAGAEYHENRVLSRSRGERLLAWHNTYIRDADGNITSVLSAGEDITARRWNEVVLEGRRKVLELLARGAPLEEVLDRLVASAEELNPNMLGSVLLVDEQHKCLRQCIAPSLPELYRHSNAGLEINVDSGCCGTAAFTGERVIIEDILNHPTCSAPAQKSGVRSCWSEPILSFCGEVLGTLTIYYRKPHVPTEKDLEFIVDSAHLAGIAIDHHRSEEQALQHQAELAHMARLNMMGEMATGMAHELNQPLAAIATYSDVALRMLRAGIREPERFAEALRGAREQSLRASEIIGHLRQLVSKQPPQKSSVDLNELVKQVVNFMASDARKQGVKFQLQLDEQLPMVAVDSIQIEQVLLNLVRNSMEAMQIAQSPRREVSIHTGLNSDGLLQLSVTDSGPGMTPEILGHIFEPFVTTKGPVGMGMGLSISRSIVEAHCGHLWVESAPGQGATFFMSLPLGAPER